MVPGLGGSKLQVTIDCEVLQKSHPEVFEECGWSTCSSWEIWKKKPAKEYQLWLPDIFGDISAF